VLASDDEVNSPALLCGASGKSVENVTVPPDSVEPVTPSPLVGRRPDPLGTCPADPAWAGIVLSPGCPVRGSACRFGPAPQPEEGHRQQDHEAGCFHDRRRLPPQTPAIVYSRNSGPMVETYSHPSTTDGSGWLPTRRGPHSPSNPGGWRGGRGRPARSAGRHAWLLQIRCQGQGKWVRPFIPGLRRHPLAGFRVVAPSAPGRAGTRRGHSPLISEEPVCRHFGRPP
jgi:hypothetical protein